MQEHGCRSLAGLQKMHRFGRKISKNPIHTNGEQEKFKQFSKEPT